MNSASVPTTNATPSAPPMTGIARLAVEVVGLLRTGDATLRGHGGMPPGVRALAMMTVNLSRLDQAGSTSAPTR